ncbi:ImmA/IrrE family metallo-endopeptidase [Weissella paramesenteroides]|uniref:ImmA/IrrE family metallo-endopeptidase n=1 Tax=Weissella paramesenteroides TaxID=1249 RepID=UPI002E7B4210|nr:ImmA/IrrE family metallo-endopeptidase [Weissella paramesenteroides]WPQ68533.1 ImmA/IrrE family metallo-endopeptidase [Weissella paramesenteroides]
MKYKEVFSPNFIQLLNDNLGSESENQRINPDEELATSYVDVESLLKKLGFEVKPEKSLGVSGELRDKTILIDKDEVEYRQRFTMAHELGHAFQGKVNAYRKNDSRDYTVSDRKDEVFANKFAAQLLMPRKLVYKYTEDYIDDKNLDRNKLNKESVKEIKDYLAQQLNVSGKSVEFRVENLNLFVRTAG